MTSPLSNLANLFSRVETQAQSAPWAQKAGQGQALQGLGELLSGGQNLPEQAGGATSADGPANPTPLGPQLPSQSFSLPLLSALLEQQLQTGSASASSATQAASASTSSSSTPSTLTADADSLASNLIATLNPGGNGELSLSQIEAALGLTPPDATSASGSGSSTSASTATGAVAQAFNALDTNKDGDLSSDELGAGLQSLAQNLAAPSSATPHHHHHHLGDAPDPADASNATANTPAVSVAAGQTGVIATPATAGDATPVSVALSSAGGASATR